jgi:membrane-associated phospholipid phosphatase
VKPGCGVLAALALAAAAHPVGAEVETPGLSYLYDGGALPFFWGALASRVAIDRWLQPPARPRWFRADEGGAPQAHWENPGWAVTATGAAVALAIAWKGDDSRFLHAKGLAETLATGSVLTAAIKVTFGRHRPDYAGPGIGRFGGENRSFLSGHSVQAFEIATYSALYLRRHSFDREASGVDRWWQGAAYAGIFAGAALVAAERVYHRRHHLSDVIAGAALGTVVAAAFFAYQDGRIADPSAAQPASRATAPAITAQWAWGF